MDFIFFLNWISQSPHHQCRFETESLNVLIPDYGPREITFCHEWTVEKNHPKWWRDWSKFCRKHNHILNSIPSLLRKCKQIWLVSHPSKSLHLTRFSFIVFFFFFSFILCTFFFCSFLFLSQSFGGFFWYSRNLIVWGRSLSLSRRAITHHCCACEGYGGDGFCEYGSII